MYEILMMTADDFKWIMSLVENGNVCTECDIFDKCQEENRDYCEKESVCSKKNVTGMNKTPYSGDNES